VFGGLLVSQLLTLYTTPVIYLALDRVFAGRAPRLAQTAVAGDGVASTLVLVEK
jgi:hypothetical protein